ncbi:CPBP family intramembrane glutamic endopeptidase [Salinibacterium sp. UTAS2018]|uniref:CPBP family intramembrane glutamic endopeptidase n=1 Tax=Salinibacterium sp. UTAS2018 TaxID=2508880 RepID=UPI00143DA74F|nr:CPBP family intramembrane glutamic endopeptidase [Salinibacterium sp. UTAS2018]
MVALLVLGALAGTYYARREFERAAILGMLFIIFLPGLANWDLATPAIGAALLLTASVIYRPWRSAFALNSSVAVVVSAFAVVLGVVGFQIVNSLRSSSSTSIGWTELPGQGNITATVFFVLIASAINATFEELLWRFAIPLLFRSSKGMIIQWILVSICFGVAHLHGTPGGMLGVLFASIFGFMMCVLRHLSHGSITWVIGVHFFADVILIGALYGIFF